MKSATTIVIALLVLGATSSGAQTMHSYTNKLISEKSPYLLQHAHNPVDWLPWGDEAFERAKAEDKPIFLSIGYATCHWCHVMERESFESVEIAELLNEAFICIKVDREERPDIDSIYMTVCQMMTGSGGWPLTIVMTPERKPFFAATYIPPDQRYGRLGMKQLIPRIEDAWKNRREEALESAQQITEVLSRQSEQGGQGEPDANLLQIGQKELMGQYDERHGGFGRAPKFPTPHRLLFLLRQGDSAALKAVEHTMKEMRKGGLFDQVGFGFHRYSTDEEWLVPHFEKMLYDQALLVYVYAEAFERTQNPLFEQVVREVCAYVMRDMTDSAGGFFSAEDADSEGHEGLFYIWSASELKALLGEDYGVVAQQWNLTEAGNYLDEATRKRTGKNIPHLDQIPDAETSVQIETIRVKLFEQREKRIHPLKDTKILADWNGLMIAALAKAARVFDEQAYLDAAERAASFIEKHMRSNDGQLWHRYRDGHVAVEGKLDDYAFHIHGLLELYETTQNIRYLEHALRDSHLVNERFSDAENGGYFMTSIGGEKLIVRPKDLYDGAIPSGNAMQWLNLLKLARLTGRAELEKQASEVARAYGGLLSQSPTSFAQALIALQFVHGSPTEIVVVGPVENEQTQALLAEIRTTYTPARVVMLKDLEQGEALAKLAPYTDALRMLDEKPTVYICKNYSCEQPVNSLKALRARLKQR